MSDKLERGTFRVVAGALESIGSYLRKHARKAARFYQEVTGGVPKPAEAAKAVPSPTEPVTSPQTPTGKVP